MLYYAALRRGEHLSLSAGTDRDVCVRRFALSVRLSCSVANVEPIDSEKVDARADSVREAHVQIKARAHRELGADCEHGNRPA